VLSTPVGGVLAAIQPDRTGWLTAGTTTEDLRAGVEALRGRRDEIERLIAEGTPRTGLEAQLDYDAIAASLLELAGQTRPSAPARPAPPPSVTALLTWAGGQGALERSLASLRAGDVPVRIVLVSTAGLPRLRLGAQVAELVVGEEGAPAAHAVAAGLRHVRGDELLLLAAGQEIRPGFLPRALAILAADAAVPYVGALPAGWGRAPLPNAACPVLGADVGSGPMVIRREDAQAVRLAGAAPDVIAAIAAELATRGRWGCIVPEPLVRDAAPDGPPPPEVREPVELAPPVMWVAPPSVLPG
jgi:hypothetical protein